MCGTASAGLARLFLVGTLPGSLRNIRLLGHANTAKVSSGGGHRDRLDRGALDITALLESPLRHLSLPACCSTNPYWATYPPSTVIVCPVTNAAASEQSHTTASAISSGRPILPTGWRATICASSVGLLVRASSINGVRI